MDPLSLTQVKRLAASADTLLLRATRGADLETPIGAFLRLDDGRTPAYLLESVEGGERLGRYSFLGIGPRRLLEVRDGHASIQERPVTVDRYDPELPARTVDAPDPLHALREFVGHRRVQPTDGMPRFTGGAVGALSYDAVSIFEPSVPMPEADPVGVPTAAFIAGHLPSGLGTVGDGEHPLGGDQRDPEHGLEVGFVPARERPPCVGGFELRGRDRVPHARVIRVRRAVEPLQLIRERPSEVQVKRPLP